MIKIDFEDLERYVKNYHYKDLFYTMIAEYMHEKYPNVKHTDSEVERIHDIASELFPSLKKEKDELYIEEYEKIYKII